METSYMYIQVIKPDISRLSRLKCKILHKSTFKVYKHELLFVQFLNVDGTSLFKSKYLFNKSLKYKLNFEYSLRTESSKAYQLAFSILKEYEGKELEFNYNNFKYLLDKHGMSYNEIQDIVTRKLNSDTSNIFIDTLNNTNRDAVIKLLKHTRYNLYNLNELLTTSLRYINFKETFKYNNDKYNDILQYIKVLRLQSKIGYVYNRFSYYKQYGALFAIHLHDFIKILK